jgi:hypothetical protein
MALRLIFFRLGLAVAVITSARSQSFDSGSNGSNGVLQLIVPGTIIFDPSAFSPTLDPAGGNIYHFASIFIAKGVTVKLSAKLFASPIFWLSHGPVRIDGTIDLNGDDGDSRAPSLAGAGGYPGGAAGRPGYRPEGFTPNAFLVPLVGGFGGKGGETQSGGGGGGALLIASSTSITLSGAITANGGNSFDGTGGDGGAIRLIAPLIDGSTGLLSAKGGHPNGIDGRVRFEAFDNRFSGSLNETPFAQGKPFGLFLPPNHSPSVRLVTSDGKAVSLPDLTINQTAPANIALEARFVPTGTVLSIECVPKDGSPVIVTTTPLTGTFELSYATASVSFPSGQSHCLVNGSWKQPPQSGPRL